MRLRSSSRQQPRKRHEEDSLFGGADPILQLLRTAAKDVRNGLLMLENARVLSEQRAAEFWDDAKAIARGLEIETSTERFLRECARDMIIGAKMLRNAASGMEEARREIEIRKLDSTRKGREM